MRILTGFLPATDGRASVGEFDVFEQPNEVKKILGYLPEVLPLYPDMTVTEYLDFVAAIKQIPAAKRKEAVAKAIKVSGPRVGQGPADQEHLPRLQAAGRASPRPSSTIPRSSSSTSRRSASTRPRSSRSGA